MNPPKYSLIHVLAGNALEIPAKKGIAYFGQKDIFFLFASLITKHIVTLYELMTILSGSFHMPKSLLGTTVG